MLYHLNVAALVAESAVRRVCTSYGALWPFVHREGLSFQGAVLRRRAGPDPRRPAAGPIAGAPDKA